MGQRLSIEQIGDLGAQVFQQIRSVPVAEETSDDITLWNLRDGFLEIASPVGFDGKQKIYTNVDRLLERARQDVARARKGLVIAESRLTAMLIATGEMNPTILLPSGKEIQLGVKPINQG